MAITFVKSTTVAASAGFTSVTVGINTTSGNLLVSHISSYAQTATPSDNKSNTWTNVASYTAANGRVRMDYVLSCTGGTSHTFTATVGSSDYPTITVEEYSWGGATGTFDQFNTDFVSAAATSHITGTITTVNAGALMVGCASSGSVGSFAAAAPFTQDRQLAGGSFEGIISAYYIPGSTVTQGFQFTTDNSIATKAIVASFNPAAGGGASAALTGVAGTGSVGTATVSHQQAITGVSGTGSVGTVAPTIGPALTGVSATGSPGTVTSTRTVPITGVVATGAVGSVSLPTGYGYHRSITISEALCGSSDSTNFPFLFNTTNASLATVANGGKVTSSSGFDIIFTSDAGGATKLDHQIERYNATTGELVAWVRVPTVSASVDTVIYVFYGNSSVTTSQENIGPTWDSNFLAVYHFGNGTTLNSNDSTSNANHLTNNGSLGAAAGQVDGGTAKSDGSSQYFSRAGLASPNSITVSFWNTVATADLSANLGAVFCFDGNAPLRLQSHAPYSDSTLYFDYGNSTTGRLSTSYAGFLDANTYVTLTYDSGTGVHNIYFNGSLAATSTASVSNPGLTGLFINAVVDLGTVSGYDKRKLDEFRLSNVARGPDWIIKEYNNVFTPGTFYALGGEISSGSITLTGVSATGSVGTVAPTLQLALTGNVATGAVGTVAPARQVSISGNIATGNVGTVTPSAQVALTGNQATGQIGSVSASSPGSAALTGVQATGSAGNLGVSRSVNVTGVVGTGAAGSIAATPQIALTGVAATGNVGSLAPSLSASLSGNTATGSVGNLSASAPGAATLTGVSATGSVGTVSPVSTRALTGVNATGNVGNVAAAPSINLTGNVATAFVGSVIATTGAGAQLTGVSASGSVGSVIGSHAHALTGVSAIGQAGNLIVPGAGTFKIIRFSEERLGKQWL